MAESAVTPTGIGAPETVTLDDFARATQAITASIERVIDGKQEAVRRMLICLLAEGHLLIEDVPGVGKTALARALAATVQSSVHRIQFTPDLLPGDVTGVSVYNPVDREFEFKPGAIFAQIVIADEINRASPKTQSALLEAMEEGQVTVDGETYLIPEPFLVVATQNPLDMAGTYALPEAQLDRFMMQISMGYPDPASEASMLSHRRTGNPLDSLQPATSSGHISELIRFAHSVFIAPALEGYAVSLVSATRTHPDLRLGASPRATLHLVRAAQVSAAMNGREFVIPDDLTALLQPVLAHRLIPNQSATRNRGSREVIAAALRDIVSRVRVPLSS